MGLRLNLGCGENRLEGYINVDRLGEPDVRHDLEQFPWPWEDSSVSEIRLIHVLEHLGQTPDTFINVMKELYRVCEDGAEIHIAVPHHRHDNFHADPTHVRKITALGLSLFSQRLNKQWKADGASNSPLGLYHNVDFEVVKTSVQPSQIFKNRYGHRASDLQLLVRESKIYNNLIEQVDMTLKVFKPPRSERPEEETSTATDLADTTEMTEMTEMTDMTSISQPLGEGEF